MPLHASPPAVLAVLPLWRRQVQGQHAESALVRVWWRADGVGDGSPQGRRRRVELEHRLLSLRERRRHWEDDRASALRRGLAPLDARQLQLQVAQRSSPPDHRLPQRARRGERRLGRHSPLRARRDAAGRGHARRGALHKVARRGRAVEHLHRAAGRRPARLALRPANHQRARPRRPRRPRCCRPRRLRAPAPFRGGRSPSSNRPDRRPRAGLDDRLLQTDQRRGEGEARREACGGGRPLLLRPGLRDRARVCAAVGGGWRAARSRRPRAGCGGVRGAPRVLQQRPPRGCLRGAPPRRPASARPPHRRRDRRRAVRQAARRPPRHRLHRQREFLLRTAAPPARPRGCARRAGRARGARPADLRRADGRRRAGGGGELVRGEARAAARAVRRRRARLHRAVDASRRRGAQAVRRRRVRHGDSARGGRGAVRAAGGVIRQFSPSRGWPRRLRPC
mmetsp:Transcript_52797/g.170170  ORF Transcript_52797/g.170170 Transcript_52797/m.170170 type:complete len:452 (+) Transcript_52797:148-1503(+)